MKRWRHWRRLGPKLVQLPAWKKVVGCKWVYTVKYRVDKSIEVQGTIGGQGVSPNLWD